MSACCGAVVAEVIAEREARSRILSPLVESRAPAEEKSASPGEVSVVGATAKVVAPRGAKEAPAVQDVARTYTSR